MSSMCGQFQPGLTAPANNTQQQVGKVRLFQAIKYRPPGGALSGERIHRTSTVAETLVIVARLSMACSAWAWRNWRIDAAELKPARSAALDDEINSTLGQWTAGPPNEWQHGRGRQPSAWEPMVAKC